MSTHSDKTRAQLEDLLERGEISREAFAEYSAAADVARPQSAMYDHVTLRIGDLAAGTALFATALEQLEIEQTATTPSFSVWDNFALTETDAEHAIARRVHVAFIAPSPGHVDRFWQKGIAAGFADDGAAGPRRVYAGDYYAAYLRDPGGSSFEAVYRDGDRPRGSIDHVALRVADVAASTAFYSTIGDAAGLTLQRQSPDTAAFAVGASNGSLLIFAGPPTQSVHIAFSGSHDDVQRFHADATAAGYRSKGEPGPRARYGAGYYAAYVLDPDGNNIEVVNHRR